MEPKNNEKFSARFWAKGFGNIIFSILFLVILFIPLFEDIIQGSPISSEAFIGKEQILSAISNFKYHVIRDRYFTGVIADPSGWVVYTGENSFNDFQNIDQFTTEEVKSIKRRLKNLCSVLTKDEIKLIVLIPPNKNTIYPEYMPAEIPQINKKSRLDQVMGVWNDTDNCKVVDLRPTMLEAKKRDKVYNATDSHWTDYGAFLAYQQLSQIMKQDFPAVKVRSIAEFEPESLVINGDLTSSFGYFDTQENAVRFKPMFETDYLVRTIEAPDGFSDMVLTFTDNPDLPTAIIYRDSFFAAMVQFILENFKEAEYNWSFNVDIDMVRAKKPDYLILEVTERYLQVAIFNIPEPTP